MFEHNVVIASTKVALSIHEYAINNNIDFRVFAPCVLMRLFTSVYENTPELRETILSQVNEIAKEIDGESQ
jgi:hypothetical protein